MKRLSGLVVTALVAVSLVGCAQKSHGFQDSPVNQKYTDNSPAQIINFPDQYFNVAEKCDHHGHMLYSNTRDSDTQIVNDLKDCPDDWPTP